VSLRKGDLEYKTKRLENASVQIILKNTPEEVESAYVRAYERAAQRVKIPGFRKGKVPLEVLERELGDAVAGDAAQILVADSMEQLISEIKPSPISVPSFSVEQFDRKQGATYKGTFDTYPEVKLGKYKKVKVTQDVPDLSEDDVNRELERLRKENSVMHGREDAAVIGDVAFVDLSIRDAASSKKLYSNADYRLMLSEPGPFPGLVNQLVGMTIGEKKSYEQDMEESFPDPKFAGKKVNIEITVQQLQYAVLPELTDDFAKEVSEFDTLAAMKQNMREQLIKQSETVLKDRALKSLLDLIAKDSKTEMPGTLVEAEVQDRIKQIARSIGRKDLTLEELAGLMGKTAEELRKELEASAESSVKKRLVLEEVAKKENISVTDEDILSTAEERFGKLGDDFKNQLLSNNKVRDELEGMALFKKTFDYLYANADIRPGQKVAVGSLMQQNQAEEN
jgi:trigger factor